MHRRAEAVDLDRMHHATSHGHKDAAKGCKRSAYRSQVEIRQSEALGISQDFEDCVLQHPTRYANEMGPRV
jgi:hypothetical protein